MSSGSVSEKDDDIDAYGGAWYGLSPSGAPWAPAAICPRYARSEVHKPMAAKEKKPAEGRGDSAMAELSRRFHANPLIFLGTIFILLFTIVAFVLVPAAAPSAGGSGKLSFGSYDGQPIEFVQGNYFAQQRDYFNQQFRSSGQDQNLQFAAFQIWRAAFESTVIHVAALQEMKKAGFVTPTAIIDRRMAEHPAFQENGRFSAAKYRAMSDADRLALRKSLKDEFAMARYVEDTLDLRVPTKEKEFMKALASPERSFEMVAFPLSAYPDSEVAAFAASKSELFRAVHFSKITISSSEGDAKKVLASVKDGTISFEDAAKTHSKDELADKGGDMGTRLAFEFATEIADEAARAAVLATSKGELSAVVKVPAGWAFFRCEDEGREADLTDAAALAKVRAYITDFERGRIEDWLTAKANDFIASAKAGGFDAAAKSVSAQKKTFGPVPLNYGDIELYRSISSFEIPELAGASVNEAFLKAAFSTPVADLSAPLVVGDNVIVLRIVEERTAEDSSTAVIDFYYPYVVGQYAERRMRDQVLASDKLKDEFYPTFINTFLPKEQ